MARKAGAGEFGDLDDWLNAENRWSEGGVSYADLMTSEESHTPIPIDVAHEGFASYGIVVADVPRRVSGEIESSVALLRMIGTGAPTSPLREFVAWSIWTWHGVHRSMDNRTPFDSDVANFVFRYPMPGMAIVYQYELMFRSPGFVGQPASAHDLDTFGRSLYEAGGLLIPNLPSWVWDHTIAHLELPGCGFLAAVLAVANRELTLPAELEVLSSEIDPVSQGGRALLRSRAGDKSPEAIAFVVDVIESSAMPINAFCEAYLSTAPEPEDGVKWTMTLLKSAEAIVPSANGVEAVQAAVSRRRTALCVESGQKDLGFPLLSEILV